MDNKILFKKVLSVGAIASILMVSACSGTNKTYYDYTNENANASIDERAYTTKSYVGASYAERQEALGILEKFAVDNFLTGSTMYESGSYALYSERLSLATNTYVTGYGWGTLTEGKINSNLGNSTTPAAYAKFYHDYVTDDPGSLNYMDDKGSVVGDLNSYVASSYWTQILNETGDGYDWVVSSATQKPVGYNSSGNAVGSETLTDTYKFNVSADFKYSTASTVSEISAYNDRTVEMEDYLTPYKELHMQKNGLARGAEGLGESSSIKGLDDYYAATANGFDQESWDDVGISITKKGDEFEITVQFEQECNGFYAMYYLNSTMMAPVPQEFVNEIGGMKFFGTSAKSASGSTLSPVDSYLTTGQFMPVSWEKDVAIAFAANPNYVGLDAATLANGYHTDKYDYYTIDGVYTNVLKAQSTNAETALNEFLANKLDAVSIPSTKLNDYKTDPRARKTVGGTTYKLNINSTTQEEWEKYFGENGTVTQTAKSNYWNVKPAMSNDDFLRGLSYAFNRTEFTENRGSNTSVDFFGSAYLSNPETGVVYGDTDDHKNAIASITNNGENLDGYNLTLAQHFFGEAAKTLIADGDYKTGDTIKIEIVWMSQSDITTFGNDIATYYETAFNGANTGLKLEVEHIVPAIWSDAYYKHMLVGQYDLAFGTISGNSLNPLSFMNNLMSSNINGFTLSYGKDTSIATDEIYYDGQYWSYDALWYAFDGNATITQEVKDGKTYNTYYDVKYFNTDLKSSINTDNGRDVVLKFDVRSDVTGFNVAEDLVISFFVTVYNQETEEYEYKLITIDDYTITGDELSFTIDEEWAHSDLDVFLQIRIDFSLTTDSGKVQNGRIIEGIILSV